MSNAYSCNESRAGKSWGQLFNKNMEDMGLVAPTNFYSTSKTFLLSVGPMVGAVERFGSTATVIEITSTGSAVTATAAVDLAIAAGALYGAWYIGAAIGSAFTASVLASNCQGIKKPATRGQMGRKNRFKKADVISFAKDNNIYAPWLDDFLGEHPEVYDEAIYSNRRAYGIRARAVA